MPTELEELVEFLHHGNKQIREVATDTLLGYSSSQPLIFKSGQLTPVQDLKLLVRDYAPIAKSALTILINISNDPEILKNLAEDDKFIESLMYRITNPTESNANEIAMLMANLAKSDSMARILTKTRQTAKSDLSDSKLIMEQLLDLFAKGADGRYNKSADFDYLAYFFADMSKFSEGQKFFTTPRQPPNTSLPLIGLTVFVRHKSVIRRRGVASAIKNAAFTLESHPPLLGIGKGSNTASLDLESEKMDIFDNDILPYILEPLTSGSDSYDEKETDAMPEELQLLPPDASRETEPDILKTHIETLLMFTGTRAGRDALRTRGVYPIIRECHAAVEDAEVREVCERLVQIIMKDEPKEEVAADPAEVDDEDRMIEIA